MIRVLCARNACLVRAPGTRGKGAVWHACGRNGTRKRGIPAVEDEVVQILIDRKWLDQTDGQGVAPGAAGLDWLAAQQQVEGCAAGQARAAPDGGGRDGRAPGARAVAMNHAESPLSWLRHRKDNAGAPILTESQYIAGERLRADFEGAGLRQSVTSRWDAAVSARQGRMRSAHRERCPSDSAIDARRRFYAALDAVGDELSGTLVDVCCFLIGLEEVERRRGWPRRSAKVVVQIALSQLARHYGLEARIAAGSRRVERSGVRAL